MAMKVVVLLFLSMLAVLTEHKAMADTSCVIECTSKTMDPAATIKCLAGCGPCPLKCVVNFIVDKSPPDVIDFATCMVGCASPFGTISNEVDETLNANMTVCNVGCSLGLCSKFLDDKDKFGACMISCRENHCIGGNIALEKA